ncbi:hypothetical protein EDC96DRAFT_547458 [Choanephora cucurbitarum]|nr:hypothetical protein EDC96DRAFT_547458 [Choanephora cucurbitarum]
MYSPRPTEWAGGSKSDIVYVFHVSSNNFPPILMEVQHTITPEFIDCLIYLGHKSNSPTSNDGISLCFSSQKLSLLSSEFQDNPTMKKLYSIAKDQTSTRIPAEKSIAEALLEVCEQTSNNGLFYTEACKRMSIRESDSLVEPMPPPPELSELAKSLVNESNSSINILHVEADLPKTDMEHIQQLILRPEETN